MLVRELQKEEFLEALKSEGYRAILIYMDSCPHCKNLGETLDEIAEEKEYNLSKIEVNIIPEIAKSLCINEVPTVLFLVDGKEVGRQIGVVSKEKMVKALEDYQKQT